MNHSFKNTIFNLQSESEFNDLAIEVFNYQAKNNKVYKEFLSHLPIAVSSVKQLEDIPFLPVEFFKSRKVITDQSPVQTIFTSSGTTGAVTSKHYVTDLGLYEDSFIKGFELFYGPLKEWTVLALLPSYLEREGSSLVYMAEKMIELSHDDDSGFFLDNTEPLIEVIEKKTEKVLLLGVSFALLDLAEERNFDWSHVTIMETGGMKGRRKEWTRDELHAYYKARYNVDSIHSEYGMTELLSQAYSKGNGRFFTPPWMKVLVRDATDPFSYMPLGKSGGLNIIDLANVNSCSFISVQDLGKKYLDGSFEVLGRFDNSDVRGCNLMLAT